MIGVQIAAQARVPSLTLDSCAAIHSGGVGPVVLPSPGWTEWLPTAPTLAEVDHQ